MAASASLHLKFLNTLMMFSPGGVLWCVITIYQCGTVPSKANGLLYCKLLAHDNSRNRNPKAEKMEFDAGCVEGGSGGGGGVLKS